MATYVKNIKIAPQSGGDGLLYASWEFTNEKKRLDHYSVKWSYGTGDTVEWFAGSSEDTTSKVSTYSPPSNAIMVKVRVTPVSKTYKKNNVDTSYYTGTTKQATYNIEKGTPLETPSAPTVTINDKYKLTAKVTVGENTRRTYVMFQVYKNYTLFNTVTAKVAGGDASIYIDIEAGGRYRVRCRAFRDEASLYAVNDGSVATNQYSLWSDYSDFVKTIPSTVGVVYCEPYSETAIRVYWDKDDTATSHTIEYAIDKLYFDRTGSTSTVTVEAAASGIVTGLDSGTKYFLRVKATNDQGDSAWSEIISAVVGTTPEAPTTWSSTTTASIGETVNLYWIHNCEDGSDQTKAQVMVKTNANTDFVLYKQLTDTTNVVAYDTSKLTAGGSVQWKVRTAGITEDYSSYSTVRTITVYEPVTVTIGNASTTVVNGLPLALKVSAGPSSQTAIRYYVTIKSLTTYTGQDEYGSETAVYKDQEIYSKYINQTGNSLTLNITAGDLSLDDGQKYQLDVTVAMSSGLSATASWTFSVDWEETEVDPDAELGYNKNDYTMRISPYCVDDSGNYYSDVTLGVYRREFDGSFTPISEDIPNNGSVTVTDPHPALDYARYRIVAKSSKTTYVNYTDLPGYPVQENSIIIQWDESWTDFDYDETTAAENPPWSGSLVKLPWNVEISENHDNDVENVEYIGRKHPVSYYGTQLGESAEWSTEIDKTDVETVYALRRLAVYMGNVYVREPSGIGYWAQVTVSMNRSYSNLVIPVSLSIKRVEGET